MCGGHKYTQGTRIGNWWEDVESKETQTKDYMHSKNADKLAVNAMQSKQAIANQPVSDNLKIKLITSFNRSITLLEKMEVFSGKTILS